MRGLSIQQIVVVLVLLLWPLFKWVTQRVARSAKLRELARRREAAELRATAPIALSRGDAKPPRRRALPAPEPPRVERVAKGTVAMPRAQRLRSVFVWMAILGPPRSSDRSDPTEPLG